MKQVKYIPVERIIENVRREVEFTDNINFADILEWVYYAMELIGAQQVYVQKTTDGNEDLGHPTPVLIENGRGELPIDLHQIIQVRDYNTGRVLRATIDSYLISKNNISFGVHDSRTLRVSNTTEKISLATDNQYGRLYNSEINSGYVGELTYSVNNSYIFTSFDSGYVEISYMAFPTDSRGFPLIPEDAKYIKAVESYIIERVARRLWLQDRMSTDKYKVLEQEWLWYVGSAKGSMNTLSLDQMESLKNQLTRLIPRSNLHDSGFKTFGDREQTTFGRKYKEKFLETFKDSTEIPTPILPPESELEAPIVQASTNITTVSFTANWTDPNDPAGLQYTIELWKNNQFISTPSLQTVTGLTTKSYTFTGLGSGTMYFYRVRCYNNTGVSEWSKTGSAKTNQTIERNEIVYIGNLPANTNMNSVTNEELLNISNSIQIPNTGLPNFINCRWKTEFDGLDQFTKYTLYVLIPQSIGEGLNYYTDLDFSTSSGLFSTIGSSTTRIINGVNYILYYLIPTAPVNYKLSKTSMPDKGDDEDTSDLPANLPFNL